MVEYTKKGWWQVLFCVYVEFFLVVDTKDKNIFAKSMESIIIACITYNKRRRG